ncbi:MAG TPA: HAD family hydrolase [Gemmataceae bacterium]|nr:HAD family hydrolase [Gemmataceae bacterium]
MTETPIEIIRTDLPRGGYKAVLFDFDGTLSLLREGWPEIMVGMMVEALLPTKPKESQAELTKLVEEFVMALNGQPAIFQMVRLVKELQSRGGTAELPADYLRVYDSRLLRVVNERVREIRERLVVPARWAVPGSHELLKNLRERGLKLYLASGTHIRHVRSEADLLEVSPFFGREINAPDGGDPAFSKRGVIERILSENGIRGTELLSFGDGVVETEEVRRVGGTAVAVASDWEQGGVNHWKRDRLVPAGADVVIPDYANHEQLVERLFR